MTDPVSSAACHCCVSACVSLADNKVLRPSGRGSPAAGKRIYALDNEPALWSSTHRDVHPARLTYDELWTKMRDTALAVHAADATAELAGPAEWGWPNYFCSDADVVSNGRKNCH